MLLLSVTFSGCTSCNNSSSEGANSIDTLGVNGFVHKYVYIDKVGVAHLMRYRIKHNGNGRYSEKKHLCPRITLGYHRVHVDSLSEKDIQFVCPNCVSDKSYSILISRIKHSSMPQEDDMYDN